jgi:diadenosine tetraphosphate (Ap4A) HIT family hydrolase
MSQKYVIICLMDKTCEVLVSSTFLPVSHCATWRYLLLYDCYICGDLYSIPDISGIARLYGSDILEQSILWQNDDLALIPAPGNITPGYLILTTTNHISRFANASIQQLLAAKAILQCIRSIGNDLGMANYVLFEHGGVSINSRGAACIDHAHWHLAPCPEPSLLRMRLKSRFKESSHNDLLDIVSLRDVPPYILLVTEEGIFSYITPEIESQYLRKHLALQWRIPEQWNWRLYPLKSNYLQTLHLFKERMASFG